MKQIPLSSGKAAVIDDQDFEKVSQYKWFPLRRGHIFYGVAHQTPNKSLFMHRLILGFPRGLESEHKNGNGLDNRRSNLRVAQGHPLPNGLDDKW